jgi:uncharacterized protein YukE
VATVTPLAPFDHEWVGGDIRGLQGVAQALYAYVPRVQDLSGRLSVVAGNLTSPGGGGWQGSAASAFTAAWQQQALTALAVQEYAIALAQVIDQLAVDLSQLENALEQQAADVSAHGVQIGPGGTVTSYSGQQGLEWAIAYNEVYEQVMSEATQARQAAAQQLSSLYQEVMNANPHPNKGDAITMAGLLADLLAVPTAARRGVDAKLKTLKGKELSLDEEIASANKAGGALQKTLVESAKVDRELQAVKAKLSTTGRTENPGSKLLDTRVSDVQNFLAGEAGPGRHVASNTPKGLQEAAAEEKPGTLGRLTELGEDIPVVDIGATLAGVAVGTYEDIKGGQSPGTALAREVAANGAGIVAGNGTAALVGAEIGTRLGAAGGPVGIVVGAVVGYGVGDLTHNLLNETWTQDRQQYGDVMGTLYGIGHSEAATADDARELAVGAGHTVETYWDKFFP